MFRCCFIIACVCVFMALTEAKCLSPEYLLPCRCYDLLRGRYVKLVCAGSLSNINAGLKIIDEYQLMISELVLRSDEITDLQWRHFGRAEPINIHIISSNLQRIDNGTFSTMERSLKSLVIEGGEFFNINTVLQSIQGVFHLNTLKICYVKRLSLIQESAFSILEFPEIVTLNLENNNIVVIRKYAFKSLEHLQYLYLAGNTIATFPPSALSTTRLLKVLDLRENSMKRLPSDLISSLNRNSKVYLQNNSISTVELDDLKMVVNRDPVYVYLEGNPVNCTCSFYVVALKNKLRSRRTPNTLIGTCTAPESLQNVEFANLDVNNFKHCYPAMMMAAMVEEVTQMLNPN